MNGCIQVKEVKDELGAPGVSEIQNNIFLKKSVCPSSEKIAVAESENVGKLIYLIPAEMIDTLVLCLLQNRCVRWDT